MLTAGGGTAAWWFLLRDSGSIIDPNMVVPADDWAAALSKDSSGTGRSSRGATRLLPDRRAGE